MNRGQAERVIDTLDLASYLPDSVAHAELQTQLRPLQQTLKILAATMLISAFMLPWLWQLPFIILCGLLGYRYYRLINNLQLHCGNCRQNMQKVHVHNAQHRLPGLTFICSRCQRKTQLYGSYNPD